MKKQESEEHLIFKPQQPHPLMLEPVLCNLFRRLSVADLKSARAVCSKWSTLTDPIFLKSVRYQINSDNVEDLLCCINHLERKYEHIYLRNVALDNAKLKEYFQKFGRFVTSLRLHYGETIALAIRFRNWMRQHMIGTDNMPLEKEPITSELLKTLLQEDLPCLTRLILARLPQSVFSKPTFGTTVDSSPNPLVDLKLVQLDLDFGIKNRFVWTYDFLQDLFARTPELCEIYLIFGNKKVSGLKDGHTVQLDIMLIHLLRSIRQLEFVHVIMEIYKIRNVENAKSKKA